VVDARALVALASHTAARVLHSTQDEP
jgi:hypothetical protein